MKSIKHMGLWWLPHDPDYRLPGTLEGDGVSRPILALFGKFAESHLDATGARPDIILGLAEDGTLVTLCSCVRTQQTIRSGGISVSSFNAGVVFAGQHFNTIDEIRFTSIAGALQHLGDWTLLDPVRVTPVPPSPEGPPGIDFGARYLGPLKINAGDMAITLGVDVVNEFAPASRYAIDLTHWITLTPSNPIGLDDFFTLMQAAQTFIAFGLRWPTHPDDIRCRSTKSTDRQPDLHLHYATVPSRLAWNELPAARCFLFKDIAGTSDDRMGKWLTMPSGLATVRDLYFSRMYASAIYAENDYLNLVQAIEAFHRETRSGRFLSKPQWKAVRRSLWTAFERDDLPITAEERCSLKLRIGSLPEHTLNSRLASLLEEFGEFTKLFIPDRAAFIKHVLKTRNYWTHYDSKRAGGQLDGYEQHILTIRLEALMELCWMDYVGIGDPVKAGIARECKKRVEDFEYLNRPRMPKAGPRLD